MGISQISYEKGTFQAEFFYELFKCVLFKYIYIYVGIFFSTFKAGVALPFVSETSEQTGYSVCSDVSDER